MSEAGHLDVATALRRYEAIRARLPSPAFPSSSRTLTGLGRMLDEFDGAILDSFGVLNVGETAIAGAARCLDAMRAAGKKLCVLTNAASYTRQDAVAKYRRLGLAIGPEEVVSSREVALAHLDRVAPGIRWAAISARGDRFGDAEPRLASLLEGEVAWEEAEGFLMLSSERWTEPLQDRLVAALAAKPRPVVVANPDLVAPRETGLTREPGFWGHDLWDRTGLAPRFFGKPYAEAFEAARARIGGGRLLMVGDTLHTDILGGRDAGMTTILVTDHGLMRGTSVHGEIGRTGIVPDVIVPAI